VGDVSCGGRTEEWPPLLLPGTASGGVVLLYSFTASGGEQCVREEEGEEAASSEAGLSDSGVSQGRKSVLPLAAAAAVPASGGLSYSFLKDLILRVSPALVGLTLESVGVSGVRKLAAAAVEGRGRQGVVVWKPLVEFPCAGDTATRLPAAAVGFLRLRSRPMPSS
jgi:hypothetical protein